MDLHLSVGSATRTKGEGCTHSERCLSVCAVPSRIAKLSATGVDKDVLSGAKASCCTWTLQDTFFLLVTGCHFCRGQLPNRTSPKFAEDALAVHLLSVAFFAEST